MLLDVWLAVVLLCSGLGFCGVYKREKTSDGDAEDEDEAEEDDDEDFLCLLVDNCRFSLFCEFIVGVRYDFVSFSVASLLGLALSSSAEPSPRCLGRPRFCDADDDDEEGDEEDA